MQNIQKNRKLFI